MKPQNSIQKINKTTNIKFLILLFVILVGYGFHPVFAAETTDTSFLDGLAKILNSAIQVGSWAWIPLATLAGKFMSNDMVYGSRFHLDVYLWQMRNLSKNFANFGLLGFLLWEIAQSVTSKKVNIQQVLGKTIIAGILIQMSRFLVGAIVDISTITTTAIGSFPASFLSNSAAGTAMDTRIEQMIKQGVITLDEQGKPTRDVMTIKNDESTADTKNKFMPKYNSVGGPLVFIGASALGIQDMMSTKAGENLNAKSVLTTFGLKAIILVFYIIILLLLLIANVMRVGYLWIFIAISPLIIMMAAFMPKKGFGDKGLAKDLTLENFISIVFKPTIFVAMMGVILVFVTSIQSMLLNSTADINGTTINQTAAGTRVEIEGIASITTNEKILSDIGGTAQSIIPNLIIYFATLFLLWLLVKTALSSGSDPIAGIMKKGTEFVEESAKTTPIVNGLSWNSSNKMTTEVLNKVGGGFGMDNLGEFGSRERGKVKNTEFDDGLREWTGGEVEWRARDLEGLQKIVSSGGEDFLSKTRENISEGHESLSSKSKFYGEWDTAFKEWIAKGSGKKFTKETDVTKINQEDWKKIHKELGGKEGEEPTSYEEFKTKEYKYIKPKS